MCSILSQNQMKQKLNPALTVFWDTDKAIRMKTSQETEGWSFYLLPITPMTKTSNNNKRQSVFVEKKRKKNRGSLWFTLSWLQESFNSSFHSGPVWSCVLPLDKHLVFWQTAFMRTLFLDQRFFEPCSRSCSLVWCAPVWVWRWWCYNHLLSFACYMVKVWINQRLLPYQSPPLARLQH